MLQCMSPLLTQRADISPLNLLSHIAAPRNALGKQEGHSGLIFANLITFPYFSISPAMNSPNSVGELAKACPPRSARRALNLGSLRAKLTSSLSFLTI